MKTASANTLLNRKRDQEDIEKWSALLLRAKKKHETGKEASYVLFRLSSQWFALSCAFVQEILEKKKEHHIPHRADQFLKGVVNVAGQLKILVDLHAFLEVQQEDKTKKGSDHTKERMIFIGKEEDEWVFTVDELLGIQHFEANLLENVPVTIELSSANYLKGIFTYKEHVIGCVHEDNLFYGLGRSLQR